jgi:tetratricopeptide (TPR) repeat protein
MVGTPICLAQRPAAQGNVGPIADAVRNRNFSQALSLSRATLAKQPNDYRIWTLRGMATAGTGNLQQALAAYQHALKLAPSYLPALEGAAQTEFQMGHVSAKPLLLKILEQRPDDATSHALLGILEYRNKNCDDAFGNFQKATVVIASQPEALTEYGTCLGILKHDEDSIAIFAKALALDPTKREARYNLALAQWNAHHVDDALNTLEPLIETSPVDGDVVALATNIFESKADTVRAIEVLRKAILTNPKNVDSYLQFATLSYDHASPQVGIDILNVGLTQLPNEPRLYLVRGILLTQLGEFTPAADDFEKASRLDPQLSFLGVAVGLVRSQQHKSAEALAEFRAAVKAHPNEAYAQYLLAEALSGEGKPAGSPEYKEELEAATQAVKLDPSLVVAHDLLSTVYYEGGQTDLAIEHSRAALDLDANDEQAIYHLIVALRKTGHKEQIPALVKRFVELRANSNNDWKINKRYLLYEPTSVPVANLPSKP